MTAVSSRTGTSALGASLAASLMIALSLLTATGGARADERCKLFAEISVDAVQKGSLRACVASRNPVVCAAAIAAEALESKAKRVVKAGCEIIVSKIGDKVHIEVTSDPARVEQMKKILEEFKAKAKRLKWLE